VQLIEVLQRDKDIMNKSFGLLLLLLVTHTIYAATFNTTTTGGNWATGSTWVGSSVPGDWASNVANIYGNVTLTSSTTSINGFSLITLNNAKSFTSGTSSNSNNLTLTQTTFNVPSGNIVIYGDLTLNDTDLNMTSGSLIVTGKLTINYSSTVTFQSGVNVTVGTLNINDNSDAILNNSGSITVAGNLTEAGSLNNLSTGTIQVNGNFVSTGSGNSITKNSGRLNVKGTMDLPSSGKLYVNPGGQTYVDGTVTVGSNENLIIGTNVNPPPYADMVIKQDLRSQGSGDITINKNGRLAVFGDVRATGGGTLFTINSGGQVFIDGDITFNGGGSTISNGNTTIPYGFYGNGDITLNGGSTTVQGQTKQSVDIMKAQDKPFYDWVAALAGSPLAPLPVTLLYFKVDGVAFNGISLKWATTTEENFDYFQLERAGSDLNFQAVAEIEGKGGLNVNSYYTYFDGAAKAGKNYYRLKSVDLDGYVEYSGVIVAEGIGTEEDIKLYPTIVDDSFTVEFNDEVSIPVRMALVDASGNTIYQENLSAMTSTVTVPQSLKSGTYLVRLFTSSGQKAIRVLKK
jgi:hypothetical protein